MNVLPELRDVTRVWTLTLPNSVMRQPAISSVNALSSSGDGLSYVFLAPVGTSALLERSASGEPVAPVASLAPRQGQPFYPAGAPGIAGRADPQRFDSTVKYSLTSVRYSLI